MLYDKNDINDQRPADAGVAPTYVVYIVYVVQGRQQKRERQMGHLLNLAQAAIDAEEQERHRHWWIHFPDREAIEVIFAPGIKHKTVLLVYPKAIAAEPIVDSLNAA